MKVLDERVEPRARQFGVVGSGGVSPASCAASRLRANHERRDVLAPIARRENERPSPTRAIPVRGDDSSRFGKDSPRRRGISTPTATASATASAPAVKAIAHRDRRFHDRLRDLGTGEGVWSRQD